MIPRSTERKKRDNGNISHKVNLRKKAIEGLNEVNVLDLFAGNNILWSYTNYDRYYGVEKEKNKGKNLNADNLRVIDSLDLSRFNVIDLDTYGMPFQQIEKIYNNPTLKDGTVIIYTCIGSAMSAVSKIAIEKFNLEKMYKKCKVLFNKKTHDMFHSYLYEMGVKEVYEFEEQDNSFFRQYGFFIVKR